MTMNEIVSSFATMDDEGNVTGFNFEEFDALVSELVTKRSEIRKSNKEAEKAKANEAKEANADVGKKYYDSLKDGEMFQYKTSDGTVVTAKKITPKAGGKSAACEVIEGIKITKSAKRYPKFYQVIVPEEKVE